MTDWTGLGGKPVPMSEDELRVAASHANLHHPMQAVHDLENLW